MPPSLLWLRRDLRLHDHRPLTAAAEAGAVQPVFVFDSTILARFSNKDDRRLRFIAASLCALDQQLRDKGGRLWVFYGKAEEIIPELARDMQVNSVFAGEDFEPLTRKRDKIVTLRLKDHGITFHLINDHLLLAPQEITKEDGAAYRVFTPYARRWAARINDFHTAASIPETLRFAIEKPTMLQPLDLDSGPEKLLAQIGYRYSAVSLWPITDGQARLYGFIREKIEYYKEARDFVDCDGTSALSPYLRFGLISIRECYRLAISHPSASAWINELIWRDFYASILYFFPDSVDQELQPQYRGLAWSKDGLLLERFTQGLTGYPIIDAAIRQLNTTGWMHNRARMIVASFLTKDLLLDWRLGEEYFAQELMDYEQASNVGGWQWAASTGTDAQPYFRIFNPTLQGKKFDPTGAYVRHYVEELRNVPTAFIHEPERYRQKTGKQLDYPAPIIDHATARQKALSLFKAIK